MTLPTITRNPVTIPIEHLAVLLEMLSDALDMIDCGTSTEDGPRIEDMAEALDDLEVLYDKVVWPTGKATR